MTQVTLGSMAPAPERGGVKTLQEVFPTCRPPFPPVLVAGENCVRHHATGRRGAQRKMVECNQHLAPVGQFTVDGAVCVEVTDQWGKPQGL